MRTKAFLVLLIGWLWGNCAMGGGGEVVRLDVPSVLRAREPGWALERREAAGKETLTYHLQQGKQKLVVAVSSTASEQDAIALMRLLARSINAQGVPLPGLGDHCLQWTSPQSGATTVIWRRGATVVHLVAPSAELAGRIAKQLDQELAD